jgi:hypothetical protein
MIFRCKIFALPLLVFVEGNVQLPVQGVLHRPVATDITGHRPGGRTTQAGDLETLIHNSPLGADGIDGDHRTTQVQQFQQFRDACDFIGFTLHRRP